MDNKNNTSDLLEEAKKAIQNAIPIAEKCPYRPDYHFRPVAQWMNDPNGLIFYKGEYHLFYQHNPYSDKWGNIHWGHAKSKDLVEWEHLPLALIPSTNLGEEHCFSGCCVNDDGIPTIIYTSIGPEKSHRTAAEQWLAKGSEDMIKWEKYDQNPIMSLELHDSLDIRDWRDPYIWKENGEWLAILGGHIHKPKQPVVLLYRSLDLINWEFLYPLVKENKKLTRNFECPCFFPLKDKHVLIVSPHSRVLYNVGSFKGKKFLPGNWYILDHGLPFYAANILRDKNNRIICWGWIQGGGKGGWNGCLSLPRILSLIDDNRLKITPAPEIEKLRKDHQGFSDFFLKNDVKKLVSNEIKLRFELKAEIKLNNIEAFGFKFDNQENILEDSIGFDIGRKMVWAGREKGTIDAINDSSDISLHLFIDNSVIEVFVNDTFCLSSRIYLEDLNKIDINLFANNGKIHVKNLDIWKLSSIW